MTGAWRIAEKDGDALTIGDTFDSYPLAKRAAMLANKRKRPSPLRWWVVINPDGAVANTGPGE